MNIVSSISKLAALATLISLFAQNGYSARLKDVVTIKGVRENILIGYGIIVGLKGSGDSGADITGRSLARLFEKLGLELQADQEVTSKNAAAVIVTAKLPPFARVGSKLDVTVSSIGDAKSLEGGVLLVTPLRAGDQNVYAVAQGPISLGAKADGNGTTFPTVGKVVDGATIEKDLDIDFASKKSFRMTLKNPDFTTAARVVALVNGQLGGKFANAKDSATIDVIVPFHYEGNTVELLAVLENVDVNIDSTAKVVLNERTGTVVIGQRVQISPVAISHGDLAIEVKTGQGDDETVKLEKITEIKKGANVSDLVKTLNALGVSPSDLTAIFQTLKKVGALQGELEMI